MRNVVKVRIYKHPQEVKRLLGIDFEQLQQLLEQGKFLHQKKQEEKEKQKIRIIKAGGGKSSKLSRLGANAPNFSLSQTSPNISSIRIVISSE